jgi:hypothetical protein
MDRIAGRVKVGKGGFEGEFGSSGRRGPRRGTCGGNKPSLKLRYNDNDLQQGRNADATRTMEGNRVEHRLERPIRLGFDDGGKEGEGFGRPEYCVGRA